LSLDIQSAASPPAGGSPRRRITTLIDPLFSRIAA
jgi:hypothetical protein